MHEPTPMHNAGATIDPKTIIAAVRAGMAAIKALKSEPLDVDVKDDASPVTAADKAAERAITALIEPRSSIPIVAEERFAGGDRPAVGRRFLLVDPLDGTKSYIAGTPDYTVNVALIEDGMPVFGCVGIPESDTVYYGGRDVPAMVERPDGGGKLVCRTAGERLDVVASKNHLTGETREYLSAVDIGEMKSIGSSLKFCLMAEGLADLYPRFGRTMQWDTAAGDAVLRAAGGLTVTVDGAPLTYGRTGRADEDIFGNPHFIALADPSLIDRAGILPAQ